MNKNVASQTWRVLAFDRTDNTPKTGDAAQISAKIAINNGTLTASNDVAPTELEDGYYEFDLTQAETNGDVLDIFPESSTADIQVLGVPGRVWTRPASYGVIEMQTFRVKPGATNISLDVRLKNVADGQPATGVDVTDLRFYRHKQLGSLTAEIAVTALVAIDSAHADNSAFEVSAGVYRCDFPDAGFADDGTASTTLYVKDNSGVVQTAVVHIDLDQGVDDLEDTYKNGTSGYWECDIRSIDAVTIVGNVDIPLQCEYAQYPAKTSISSNNKPTRKSPRWLM